MAFNVKARKRELINENIKLVPVAAHGAKLAGISILSIVGLRLALLLFEIIYALVIDIKISIWSHLLLLPFFLVLYMLYDGNKSFVYISLFSAPLRLVYHFAAVVPLIASKTVSPLTVVTVVIFAAQFFISVYLSASTKCDSYFLARQKVNLKLRSEMINGRK